MPRSTKHRILFIALPILVIVLLTGVAVVPGAATRIATLLQSPKSFTQPLISSPAQATLSDTLNRATQSRTYRYTSDIDQTMIPRAVPGMIGQQDQYMTLAIEGEILAADRSRTTLQFDPGSVSGMPSLRPVTIVRNGAELYAEREGERQSFQNETLSCPAHRQHAGLFSGRRECQNAGVQNRQRCDSTPALGLMCAAQ